MSTKYKLRITGECKQNMKLCKRRGLPRCVSICPPDILEFFK